MRSSITRRFPRASSRVTWSESAQSSTCCSPRGPGCGLPQPSPPPRVMIRVACASRHSASRRGFATDASNSAIVAGFAGHHEHHHGGDRRDPDRAGPDAAPPHAAETHNPRAAVHRAPPPKPSPIHHPVCPASSQGAGRRVVRSGVVGCHRMVEVEEQVPDAAHLVVRVQSCAAEAIGRSRRAWPATRPIRGSCGGSVESVGSGSRSFS